MSNKPNQPNDQRRRDEETRLSMSHLAGSSSTTAAAAKDKDEDDDEDWGDVSPSKPATSATKAPVAPVKKEDDEDDEDLDRAAEDLDDEDLERELAGSEEEEEEDEDDEDEPVNQNTQTPARVEEKPQAVQSASQPTDDDAMMRQLDQLQNNLPAMERMLSNKLEQINQQRKKLDEEEKGIRSRINFLRVLSGKQPLAVEEEEDDEAQTPNAGAPRRRRRRASAATTEEGGTATAAAAKDEDDDEDEAPATGGRGGRGKKRFVNEKSWKEVICEALLHMKHPQTNKPFTGFVNDITTKVTLPTEKGGLGYKTTSAKPTNTVRIQIYRLEKEGKLIGHDDGSYTLKKSAIREMGHDPAALAGE